MGRADLAGNVGRRVLGLHTLRGYAVVLKKEKLTPRQRNILTLMAERGPATFTGRMARKHGFGVADAKGGGIVIRSYQFPQYFLLQRGLVEKFLRDDNTGTWYAVTQKGRDALDNGDSSNVQGASQEIS